MYNNHLSPTHVHQPHVNGGRAGTARVGPLTAARVLLLRRCSGLIPVAEPRRPLLRPRPDGRETGWSAQLRAAYGWAAKAFPSKGRRSSGISLGEVRKSGQERRCVHLSDGRPLCG